MMLSKTKYAEATKCPLCKNKLNEIITLSGEKALYCTVHIKYNVDKTRSKVFGCGEVFHKTRGKR